MHFTIMGISVDVETYGFKDYWRYWWRGALVALRLRKPKPTAEIDAWIKATQDSLWAASTFSSLIDRRFDAETQYGDTIHIATELYRPISPGSTNQATSV